MGDERFTIVEVRNTDDPLDAFPAEEREEERKVVNLDAAEERMRLLADLDVWDRAIANDSQKLAMHNPSSFAAAASVTWSRSATLVLGLVAVIGWGAFVFERTRALPLDFASIEESRVRPDALIDAKPLRPVARTARPVRPVTPPAAAITPIGEVPPTVADVSAPPPVTTPAMDVSGAWVFSTTTRSGMRGTSEHFHVELTQRGGRVYGIGRPVSESGAEIGKASKSPITIRGTMDAEQLTLTFRNSATARGAARTFVLRPEDDSHLRGNVNASRASAAAEARRR
jgi:hypothetical protein